MTSSEKTIREATFHDLVRIYLFLYVLGILFISLIGLPVVPFWIFGLGQWWAARYFRRLKCVLREKSLYFRRGVLIRSESTIPLDRITDLTVKEGPLLRALGLSSIRVETPGTSGQGGGAGGISLIGIVDTPDFRDTVLAQRERVLEEKSGGRAPAPGESELLAVVKEIRDIAEWMADQRRER